MELIISASAAKPAAKPVTVKAADISTAVRDEFVALLNKHAGAKSVFTFAKGKSKAQIKVVSGKASRVVDINAITTLKGKVQKASLKIGESNKLLPVSTITETRAKLTILVNSVLKDVAGFVKIASKPKANGTQGGAKPATQAPAAGHVAGTGVADNVNAKLGAKIITMRGKNIFNLKTKTVIGYLVNEGSDTISLTVDGKAKKYTHATVIPAIVRLVKKTTPTTMGADSKPRAGNRIVGDTETVGTKVGIKRGTKAPVAKPDNTPRSTKAAPVKPPVAKAPAKGKTTKAEPAAAKHNAKKPATKTSVDHKVANPHKQGKTTQPKVDKLKHDAARMAK
jgi:hypothetical protein